MLTVFDNLFQNEALVDVTLACEGLSLKAHKMVLSACSPFFQSLFIDNPCKHPIVILKDVRFTDLKALVDFMYKGEVNVSQDQLNRLLKTAETLKVRGLAEVTSGYCIEENGAGSAASGMAPPPTPSQNSQGAYENSTSRSPQQQQMSPPRKRKKTKHRSRGEKHTSHSEQEDSDGGPEMIEPKVEITEDNFSADKSSDQLSTTRHNQESPRRSGDDKSDLSFAPGTSASSTPNARSGNVQNQSGLGSLTSVCSTSTDGQLSNQSSSHQNASQVYVSPGHDVSQLSGDYSSSALAYKRPKGGRPTILYEEEEEEIVRYIEAKAVEGNPVDIRKILDYGNKLLRREGRRPTGSMYMYCSETVKGLSIKWWRGFKKRHPGLPYTRQKPFVNDDVVVNL